MAFAVMGNPPRAVTAKNEKALTTFKETHETDIQTPLKDFENIEKFKSYEGASISSSHSSADTKNAIFAAQHGYDNGFSSKNSQDSQFSSPLKESSDFDMPYGSKNHSVSYHKLKVSFSHRPDGKRSESNHRIIIRFVFHQRYEPEICFKSSKDLSTDSKQGVNNDNTLKLNATSQVAFDNSSLACIDGQNIESNNKTSEIAQNDNAISKFSDSMASEKDSTWMMDDLLANPCPSSSQRTIPSNLCEEALESFTCRVCKREISKHATKENIFECCICSHAFREEVNLQIHSCTHVTKKTCNICEKEHAVGNSHISENMCPVCLKTFECRSRLYEHILEHRKYYEQHCWVCSRKFYDHKTTDKSSYACCVCGYKSNELTSLKMHNVLHLPRFFCKICKEVYIRKQSRLHGSKLTCYVCPKIFKCQTQLVKHCEDDHGYSCESCRLFKRSINKHFIGSRGGKDIQSCNDEGSKKFDTESTLQNCLFSQKRLQIPKSLRLCKCNTCGRRFNLIQRLLEHFPHCKALVFICKICERKISLFQSSHQLVNNRQA